MKRNHIQKISFLADKKEMELLDEACLFGADADEILDRAVKDNGRYRIEFLYEELDDLVGFIASCANHEESKKEQEHWDKLYIKINGLLEFMEREAEKTKKQISVKPQCQLKYYIFDVWLREDKSQDISKRILRKIQIAESKSLYNFAKVITQAFSFEFDHCFGFYDNLEKYHNSKKAYELFYDIGEESLGPHVKGVKKTKVSQAFKDIGEKMMFLFDYGDGWRFHVELKEIKNAKKWDLKPVILKRTGKAPIQYPPCRE